uniref:Putative secreted protein n=1 Tax=Ixodes ricinus TaxID=34613 RepID=A0A6B0U6E9_IXORI
MSGLPVGPSPSLLRVWLCLCRTAYSIFGPSERSRPPSWQKSRSHVVSEHHSTAGFFLRRSCLLRASLPERCADTCRLVGT